MPYINVKVAGKIDLEQKRELSKRISQSMEDVLGKPKASCYIVFDEISRDNWAKGEEILSDKDAQK